MSFLFTLKFLKIAIPSIVILALLDYLFLGWLAAKFYAHHIGHIAQLENGKITFNLPMGILAQIAVSLLISVFVVTVLQLDNRLWVSVISGAGIAFLLYAVYDFTNLSFVKGYPLILAVTDIAWGVVQGAAAGVYVYFFNKYF
jgi:uncharacterized membrane protein